LCARARLLREFVIAYLKGRLVDQFGLASGFASLSACGRLGLRRATLYHCAAKDDLPAPAAITAWHDFVSTTPPTMPAITSQILIMNAVPRAACSKPPRFVQTIAMRSPFNAQARRLDAGAASIWCPPREV
jgi:hypothetical protein